MATRWLRKDLTGGVVKTRDQAVLNSDELTAASFVRLQPGNRDQLYLDFGYEEIPLGLNPNADVIDLFYMNFEGGFEWLVLVVNIAAGSPIVEFYDLNSPLLDGSGTWTPNITYPFGGVNIGNIVSASLINRGAEYFLGLVFEQDDGFNLVLTHDGTSLDARAMGLLPSSLDVQVTSSYPIIQNFGIPESGDDSDISSAYSFYDLINTGLYGNIQLSEFADRRDEFIRSAKSLVEPRLPDGLSWVPISQVRIVSDGGGVLFGYWATEYETEWGVESAPTDLVTSTNVPAESASFEVTFSFARVVSEGHLTGPLSWYEWFLDRSDEPSANAIRDSFRDGLASGDIPETVTLRLPLTQSQREELSNTITIGSAKAQTSADQVRLYRQALGLVSDVGVYYFPESFGIPSLQFATAEGTRNAEEINSGLQVRQGGLLETFGTDELPIEYTDDIAASGTADPATPYPTIPFVTQSGFAVYELLRKPEEFSVGTTFGQSLLRVEPHGLGATVISASPADYPEQAPAIYGIPVASDRQDEITALVSARNVVIVFTGSSAFRLNYIPAESNAEQTSVLTRITSHHGCVSKNLVTTVESVYGQLVVWLSRTGLMATNGSGFFDFCPDFSVETALRGATQLADCHLVNNPAAYRLELWEGNRRWDFYYHRTHLKDVRGDGSGLVSKLMGPTSWYSSSSSVEALAQGAWEDRERTFHIVRRATGEWQLQASTLTPTENQASVTTGVLWGSNPQSRLRTHAAGAHYGPGASNVRIAVANYGVNEGAGGSSSGTVEIDELRRFAYLTPADGVGSGSFYVVSWQGSQLGPMWLQLEDLPSGRGR